MVSFLLSFLIVFNTSVKSNESFEGKIDLIYQSLYDTSYITYFIKQENIRIDRYDKNHLIEQSMIINLNKEEVFILSPDKKLYSPLALKEKAQKDSENYIILKTENSRMVNGYLCYQWRVKNIDRNTEVAYWVSQNNYFFFNKLIELLNRTDNTYEFFEKIPDTQGFLPMLSVERTLLRREKSRIIITNIYPENIDNDLFSIPQDYKMVRR